MVSHAAQATVCKKVCIVSVGAQKSEPGRGVGECNSGEVSPGRRPLDPSCTCTLAIILILNNGGFVQLVVLNNEHVRHQDLEILGLSIQFQKNSAFVHFQNIKAEQVTNEILKSREYQPDWKRNGWKIHGGHVLV